MTEANCSTEGAWGPAPTSSNAEIADQDVDVLALDAAMQGLAAREPVIVKLIELRFFAGWTGDLAAEVLNISPSTADRHWVYARSWLQAQIRGN